MRTPFARSLPVLALAATGALHAAPAGAARGVPPGVHTRLEESVPAAGETLRGPLEEFRLRFSAPVESGLSEIRLVGPDADTTTLALRGFADSAGVLRAHAPPLRDGAHKLLWRSVSADGHPVEGSIPFQVAVGAPEPGGSEGAATDGDVATDEGVAADEGAQVPARDAGAGATPAAAGDATPSDEASPSLRLTLLAGLGLACLLAAAGLLWFAGGTSLVREPRVLRVASATALGAVILLTLAHLDWVAGVLPAGAGRVEGLLATLETRAGAVGAARVVLALLVFLLVGGAHAGRLAAVLAMTAVVLGAAAGHPAAIEPAVAIGANALHVGAAAIWIGGVLLLAVLPDRSELADAGWRYAEVAGRVSSRAFLAVGVIVGTALVQDFLFLNSLPDLWRTPYGRLLLAKGAGLGLLVAFGVWHRWRTLPRLAADGDPGPLRRAVRVEVWVLLAVVLVAAWLSRVPPPVAG
ncbi:MAG: copper resistance protein CopC [Gemmatimonadota bacterium]